MYKYDIQYTNTANHCQKRHNSVAGGNFENTKRKTFSSCITVTRVLPISGIRYAFSGHNYCEGRISMNIIYTLFDLQLLLIYKCDQTMCDTQCYLTNVNFYDGLKKIYKYIFRMFYG